MINTSSIDSLLSRESFNDKDLIGALREIRQNLFDLDYSGSTKQPTIPTAAVSLVGTAIQANTGGNTRGTYATDFQRKRSAATMVAAGKYALIGGGRDNTVNTTYSQVLNGKSNSIYATATYSTILNGGFNTITGASQLSLIASGYQNSITNSFSNVVIGGAYNAISGGGNYSAIIGGRHNSITTGGGKSIILGGDFNVVSGKYAAVIEGGALTVSANYAVGMGKQATISRYGEFGIGGGLFASGSYSQSSKAVMRIQTTDATATEMFLLGATNKRFTLASGKVCSFVVHVVGRSSSGTKHASFIRRGIIQNTGGTTALVGSIATIGTDVGSNAGSPPAGWDVTITADDTNDSLKVAVTGEAALTVRWSATIEAIEVTY